MVNQKLGFITVAICFGYITTLTDGLRQRISCVCQLQGTINIIARALDGSTQRLFPSNKTVSNIYSVSSAALVVPQQAWFGVTRSPSSTTASLEFLAGKH